MSCHWANCECRTGDVSCTSPIVMKKGDCHLFFLLLWSQWRCHGGRTGGNSPPLLSKFMFVIFQARWKKFVGIGGMKLLTLTRFFLWRHTVFNRKGWCIFSVFAYGVQSVSKLIRSNWFTDITATRYYPIQFETCNLKAVANRKTAPKRGLGVKKMSQ